MWNLSKLLSALWGILGLLALVVMFLIYANFPEFGNLDFLGLSNQLTLDRHTFFFLFTGLFLTINLTTYAAVKVVSSVGRSSRFLHGVQQLRILVAVKILACGANLFLMALMIFLKSAIEAQSPGGEWQWLWLSFGPFIMLLGLGYLVYTMLFPAKQH